MSHMGNWGYLGVFAAELGNSATIIIPTPGPVITLTLASILNPLLVGLVGGIAAAIGELSGYAVGATGRQALEGSRIYERFQALAQRRVGPALFVFAALRSIRYRWHMGGHCPLLATALPAIRDCGQGHKSHNFCIRRILWNELASRLIISYVARITFLVNFLATAHSLPWLPDAQMPLLPGVILAVVFQRWPQGGRNMILRHTLTCEYSSSSAAPPNSLKLLHGHCNASVHPFLETQRDIQIRPSPGKITVFTTWSPTPPVSTTKTIP